MTENLQDNKVKWHVLQVYSSFENTVADSVKVLNSSTMFKKQIIEVLIPQEEVETVRRGKKIVGEKQVFPGYILINAMFSDDLYSAIISIPKAIGFLSSDNIPVSIPKREINKIKERIEEGFGFSKSTTDFEVGETIKVTDGPFISFSGIIEEVDIEKSRLKVSISIFGRETPVDLEFGQAKKTF